MDITTHIVRHDLWCKKCKHFKLDETLDPCNECLDNPENTNSKQPTLFEEDD